MEISEKIQSLYWHTKLESYWGAKIFRVMSKDNISFQKKYIMTESTSKPSVFGDPLNSELNANEIKQIEIIHKERKMYKSTKISQKAKLKILGTSTIALVKSFLLTSIPTFLVVSFLTITFYLPLHLLKGQSTNEIKQRVLTDEFILTQDFLDNTISTPKPEQSFVLSPPTALKITTTP